MSTSRLCPCPACNRHVKTDAGVCPFCEAALPESFCEMPPAASTPRPRLSRAARLLAGATLVGASACSTEMEPAPVVHYGAPIPADAAVEAAPGTGAGGGTGNDGGPGRVIALYGGPPIRFDGGAG